MKKEQRYRFDEGKYDIEQVIKRISGTSKGDSLIIPEYQRDYVWKDDINIPSLLSSLYIGYPIGFISVWDNHREDQHQLIDGLQRHYSIYKINEKPFNYLHYDMLKYWMEKNGHKIKDEKEDRENFRHFRSKLNHKNTNYKKMDKEGILGWINKTSRLDDKYKDIYKEFINDYEEWFKNVFPKIKIPHIILSDDYTIDEVSRVFELINSTGKKLNKFEIQSAQWSKYKIKLDSEIGFISNFQNERIRIYKSAFEKPDNISENLIKYNNKKIIPSNFIYAIFDESIKGIDELKYSFYDKNNKLQTKAIEAVSEIIKESLIKQFNLDDFTFEDLGKKLSENIKTKEHVEEMVKIINNAFEELLKSISFLRYAKTNNTNKNIVYASWLISVFVIFMIKNPSKEERKNYKRWFIYEILFENNYSSSTGNYAKSTIKDNLYNHSLESKKNVSDKELVNKMKSMIDENEVINDSLSKVTNKEKLLLSIISFNFYKPANTYDIDHLIPQSILKKIKNVNYNSISNLQYLDSLRNKTKGKDLSIDQIEWDVLKNKIIDTNKKDKYNELMEYISSNISNSDFNIDKLEELINIRKEIYESELEKLDWLKH